MKNKTLSCTMIGVMLLPIFLFLASCEDKMEEHYKAPDWLKGSIYELLEDRGNFTLFLKAVDMSGFKPLLQGKAIATVMAPEDDAFKAYLQKHGYSDLSEMSIDAVKKLIGFHVFYYTYNKGSLINFRPEGDAVTEAQANIQAGMYYKFRTRSNDPPTVEEGKVDTVIKRVTVYHLDRFCPVFSYRFFQTKQIDPVYNYEYFYPESDWKDAEGFNVSNASIKEYELLADNGYVYVTDQVLEPLETLYVELKKNPAYSKFLRIFEQYGEYVYDSQISTDFGTAAGADSLWIHSNKLIPIAMEWSTNNYQSIKDLSSQGHTLFALTDNAIDRFFNNFWAKGGYESYDKVDKLVLKYLVYQFYKSGAVAFPEEIKKGLLNLFNVPFGFDPDAITERKMCVNGAFYGLNDIGTPSVFASVLGPAFRDTCSLAFAYTLDLSGGLASAYASNAGRFTMFVPTNVQYNKAGMYLNYYPATGNRVLEQPGQETEWSPVSGGQAQEILRIHALQGDEALPTTGVRVLPSQATDNFLFFKDGKVTSSGLYNASLMPGAAPVEWSPFKEITNDGRPWSNGRVYAYEGNTLLTKEASQGLSYSLAICNDSRYPYYAFAQLLKKAGMVDGTIIPIFVGAQYVAFIPSNDAILAALQANQIPGISGNTIEDATVSDPSLVGGWVASYIIRKSDSYFAEYPYLGSAFTSGVYTSVSTRKLKYTDNGSKLSVQFEGSSNVVDIASPDGFPYAFDDGCFHLLNAIL